MFNRSTAISGALLASVLSLGLAGCSDSSSDDSSSDGSEEPEETATAQVRVIHASADAPNVTASLNGGDQIPNLAFGQATDYLEVDEGDFDVTVSPAGGGDAVIDAPGVPLSADDETNILAVGNLADIEPLIVTVPDDDPAGDEVRAKVIHASAAAEPAGDLDVYVTPPNADLDDSDVTPIGTFGFKGDLGPATVPEGDYRIRVTATGDTTPVYDSGSVALEGGSDLVISAIDSEEGGSPVQLLVAPEGGDSFKLPNREPSQARVRVIHAAADAPDVNVSLDSGNETETFEGLGFSGTTALTEVPAGTYDVTVEAVLPDGSAQAVLTDQVELTEGDETTLVAAGSAESQLADNDPGLKLVEVTPSDETIREDCGNAEAPCRARYTLVHAAANAGPVEITATTPDNSSITDDAFFEFDFENDNQSSVELFAGLQQKPRRIRIAPDTSEDRDGTDANVVFDTGSQLPSVPAGEDILAIVIDNVGTSAVDDDARPDVTNPARLLLIYPDGQGGSNDKVFRDKDAQPAIRAAHLSQDAGGVNILANGQNINLNGVPFTTVSPYLPVSELLRNSDGSLTVQVNDSDGAKLAMADIPLTDGEFHTGYAVGLAANTNPGIELIGSSDAIRPVATEAQVRLVHAATQPGAVDVYATPQGGSRTKVVDGFEFKSVSPYRSLPVDLESGTQYDFEVFAAGADPEADTPAISVTRMLNGGDVVTAIARDDAMDINDQAGQFVDDDVEANALNSEN